MKHPVLNNFLKYVFKKAAWDFVNNLLEKRR